MIFTDINEIKLILENPISQDIINRAIQIKKEHELHICGLGLEEWLKKNAIGNEEILSLRKKYASERTKAVYSNALKPIEKIFSAKGTTRFYNIDDEDDKKYFKNYINSNLGFANGIKHYISTFWKDYVNIDPLGMFFLEIDSQGNIIIDYKSVYKRNNNNICNEIYDFFYKQINKLEYIVFYWYGNDKNKQYYRVIDDAKDYIISKDKLNNYIIENEIDNYFGVVPAIIFSNKFDKKNIRCTDTYISDSIPIANEYLNDYINHGIYKSKVNLPIVWQYKQTCIDCQGSGSMLGQSNEYSICSGCNGTGFKKTRNIGDVIEIPLLEKGDAIPVPPAGYIQPDASFHQLQIDELNLLQNSIIDAIWGAGTAIDNTRANITAFEISVRNEIQIAKLNQLSDNAEYIEKNLTDLVGIFLKNTGLINSYNGCGINYSRNYINQSVTESIAEYNNAKINGASQNILNELYFKYLSSAYENNSLEFERQTKIFLSQPFPHYNLLDLNNLGASDLEKNIKKNFEFYLYEFESEYNIYESDVEFIRQKMIEYASTTNIEEKKDLEENDTIENEM